MAVIYRLSTGLPESISTAQDQQQLQCSTMCRLQTPLAGAAPSIDCVQLNIRKQRVYFLSATSSFGSDIPAGLRKSRLAQVHTIQHRTRYQSNDLFHRHAPSGLIQINRQRMTPRTCSTLIQPPGRQITVATAVGIPYSHDSSTQR